MMTKPEDSHKYGRGFSESAMSSSAFTRLQNKIWDILPDKKHAAGKEKVFDIISIVVQEWPEKEFGSIQSTPEDAAVSTIPSYRKLVRGVKRHMDLLYGQEEEFGTLWIIALELLVSQIIRLILRWWLENRRNQRTLRNWRQRWAADDGKHKR